MSAFDLRGTEMNRISHGAYKLLLRLHPAEFRIQFADEMMLDYQTGMRDMSTSALYWDALLSLGRQWINFVSEVSKSSARGNISLIGGQYVAVSYGGLTPFDLMKGAMLSFTLFLAVASAESPAFDTTIHLHPRRAFVTGSQSQGSSRTATDRDIAVRDVTVIDVEHGILSSHVTVLIHGDQIIRLFRTRNTTLPSETEEIDGRGKFLIPGFWDMHTHIAQIDVDMPLYIANGVLGLRNMGGVEDKVFALKHNLQEGTVFGPRMFIAGPILDSPDGPVQPPSYGDRIANAAQGRAEVDRLKAEGADFIKVYDGLSRESYFAIAAEANRIHIPFAGHVPPQVTIEEAIDAGQKSIEHGIEARGTTTEEQHLIDMGSSENVMAEAMRTKNYSLIPESIARNGMIGLDGFSQSRASALYASLVKHDTYLCPTLVTQHWVAYGDDLAKAHDPRERFIRPETLVYWQPSMNMLTKYRTSAYVEYTKRNYAAHLRQIPREEAVGVQFLTGTDLTVPYTYPGSSVHDEMKLFVTAGLTPLQALQTAVTHPVEYFGLEQTMGSVRPGKLAELVLLDGNPLLDIGNTDRIAAVITHGKLIRKPELDAMLLQAERTAHNSK
jgi:imidazolonepropionase-like amidohydrolase